MFKEEIKDYGLDVFAPNLTTDISGFISIALVALLTLYIASRWPDISKIILVALVVRIFAILIGHYFFHLPDTTADAIGYEWGAWNFAKDGFFNIFENFTGPSSQFYSWVMSIPYSLFGRNILFIQSIGLFFGVGSVFLGWLFAKQIWDDYSAMKVGWVLALFPSLVLYSIIPLKEVFCSFFILVAMIGIANWVKTKKFKFAILSIGGFMVSGFFHGPLFLGGLIFAIILCVSSIKNSFYSLLFFRIKLKDLVIIILIPLFFLSYLSSEIYLPYIGTFENSASVDTLISSMSVRLRGTASYPDWLLAETTIELIYKSFFRIAYFLFSPFPWAIKEPIHLIGVLDGLLYLSLSFSIIFNLKVIWKDPMLRIILIILSFYLLMYGIGVSNFGAGIRHRSKFIIEMVLLAAPLIPTFTFQIKRKLSKHLR